MKKVINLLIIMTISLLSFTSCENSTVQTVRTADDYRSLVTAISKSDNGDTIRLNDNIELPSTLVIKKTLTLDLNGYSLYNSEKIYSESNSSWSLLSVRGFGNVRIMGNGQLAALDGDCYALDTQDITARVTIENGEFVGNITSVYCWGGNITINGGSYSIKATQDEDDPYQMVINLNDANGIKNSARIVINGGTFMGYDPANSYSEPDSPVNLVSSGHKSTKEIGEDGISYYIVK